MRKSKLKLGEMLLKQGLINEEQLKVALEKRRHVRKPIGDLLVELGYVTEKDIVQTLAIQLEIPYVSLEKGLLSPKPGQDLEKLIPPDVARQYYVLPLAKAMNSLTVAISDPLDVMTIDNLKNITRCEVNPVIATKSEIKEAIDKFYGEEELLKEAVEKTYELGEFRPETEAVSEIISLDQLVAKAETAPIIKLVDLLLMEAIKSRASDIHIEPFEKEVKIRYRIDGVLYEIPPPAEHMIYPLVSRLKIISKLDIAEKRLPQDGAFSLRVDEKLVDFRISTMPTIFGEKMVIRILDKSTLILKLEDLGFDEFSLKAFRDAIVKPYGLIFVTGPTGCGKSTTLYATLMEIASPQKNVITIEDPVEYRLSGVNQVQVKPSIGLTFASGLRTSLRQDPDIILVGEVRDLETAESCVRAALTGHLVLSTLHTNDAPGAVTRLVDFGIEPFLLGSCMLLVAAQRLVRSLCPKCKVPYRVSPKEAESFKLNTDKLYRPKGCDACRQTGYRGRVGIHEVMSVTPQIKDLIYKGATSSEIKELARRLGMKTLMESGRERVEAGITSLQELLSTTYEVT